MFLRFSTCFFLDTAPYCMSCKAMCVRCNIYKLYELESTISLFEDIVLIIWKDTRELMTEQLIENRFRYCQDRLFNKQIGIKPTYQLNYFNPHSLLNMAFVLIEMHKSYQCL